MGKLTPDLCQYLDGSLHGDVRAVFTDTIAADECMIIFHLPNSKNALMNALLVWRDPDIYKEGQLTDALTLSFSYLRTSVLR